MRSLKLQKMGDGLGVLLPPDVLEHLDVREGDNLYLAEMADGTLRITQYNPEYELQMRAVRVGMFKYKKTMKALS